MVESAGGSLSRSKVGVGAVGPDLKVRSPPDADGAEVEIDSGLLAPEPKGRSRR